MLERWKILKEANIKPGSNVLDVGCGPHAIATITLAIIVGDKGRVVALDRGRWGEFNSIVEASGLQQRIIPLQEDAQNLPFPYPCFDLVVCIHGIRSFDDRDTLVQSVKEMRRVSRGGVFLAESSPIVRNMAQKAHLKMYNLRRPVYQALGREHWGDVPYYSEAELEAMVKEAGASHIEVKLIDVDLPHHLAWFPLEMVEKIHNAKIRSELDKRWRNADKMLEKYGEEHTPVIVINAN